MRLNSRLIGAAGASLVLFIGSSSTARAGGFISATGSAPDEGSSDNLTYQFAENAGTTFRTWQWLGGTNAAGDSIPGGGIDTEIEVFNSSNVSVDYNDDIGPGNRDSMLSDTGTGVTFMPAIGPGQFRLKLNKVEFTNPGDGRWALDAVRPTTTIKLVARSATASALQSLKFGSTSASPAAPGDAEVLVSSASQALQVIGPVDVRNGGALRVSNGTFSAGTLHVSSSALAEITGGNTSISSQLAIDSGGSMTFAGGSLHGGNIVLNGGQLLLTSGGNKLLRGFTLTTSGGGKADLSDNDMQLSGATLASVISQIVSARNGGAWDGPAGITSSAAAANANHTTTLGVLSGSEYASASGTTTFDGQATSSGDVLVKYTWNGDANFDGRVTFDDYVKIDTGFNTHLTGWLNGDFNYSGAVNFDDYVLIDIAFNQQNGTLGRAMDWISGDDRSGSGRTDFGELSRAATGVSQVIDHLQQFGPSYGAAFLAAVPEPISVTLLGVPALAGVFHRRLRPRAR